MPMDINAVAGNPALQGFIFGMCAGGLLFWLISATMPAKCHWCKRHIPPKV